MILEIQTLLAPDHVNELGPGSPNLAMRVPLQALQVSLLDKPRGADATPLAVNDRDFAAACMAGLWLLHDFHDESHAISQDLDTVEGSYWHGILHRREPDYWNAKYWFRRVPTHAIFKTLAADAATLTREAGTPTGSEFLLRQATWDCGAFVDLCEKTARGPDDLAMLCRRIQRREWDLLFGHCYERAFAI